MTLLSPPRWQQDFSPQEMQTHFNGPPARGLTVGMILDGLRIDHHLGHGGMGVVYAAWDLRHDRPAAVKVLGGAIGSDTLFARFRREAATIARLRHPGIVRLLQLGQTADVCYLAMQRVEGVTLRDWLNELPAMTADRLTPNAPTAPETPSFALVRTARFDIEGVTPDDVDTTEPVASVAERPALLSDPRYIRRVAEMLRDLADALSHAHAAQVTHRDLKPENVMVQPDGRVVIIDFGLARSFADTTLTTHSGLIGTPLYMSPEQLRGRPAGPQADVYALGLIGYELLTRTLPYRARTVESLLGEVLNKPAPPLTDRNPAVPPELANVVHQALAKSVSERYPTAEAMRADLDHFLSGERVSANRYRYRFRPRDVLADRPTVVALAGYSNMVTGGFMAMAGFVSLANATSTALLVIALSIGYIALGWRLHSGRRLARTSGWLSVPASLAAGAFTAIATYRSGQFSWWLPALFALNFAWLAAITVLALLSRTSVTWYIRMAAERRVFDAERTGVVEVV